ncbi:MAG TPA: 4a-hydroxytetrahydrobiopterin dehydratase [Candidatus Binatia bacterium]|nr:4a-hydroxytetrahydrobiopterin dehydratase [Candidatus Binatia bacterium]
MTALVNEHCKACDARTPRLEGEELERLSAELSPQWTVEAALLRRRMRFPDFVRAAGRAMEVALLAEAEGHHPDLLLGWGYLDIELTTHAISGLSRNDFILAAKIDSLDG